MKKKIFGLPKNVFLLGLVSFFNDFSSEMVYSIFPAFFTSVLKSGAASLGIVEGFADGVSNIFKIYSGNLSDRLQKRKPFIIGGYALSLITRPFYSLIGTVGGAFGLRFIDRVGKGMRDAPRDAIISLSTPKKEFGKAFGYHRSMDVMGAIFGPFVAFLILEFFPMNFNLVFMTAFVVGVFSILTLFFVSDVKNHFVSKGSGVIASFKYFSWKFRFFLLSIVVLSMGSIPVAILLLKTEHIGLAIASIPLFYMIYNLSYAVISPVAGIFSDKLGTGRIILAGYSILILSYVIFYYTDTVLMLVFGFIALGFFSAFTDGVQRSMAAHLTEESLRGEAMGLVSASIGVGVLIAGVGGGYIWQIFGSGTAFITASSVTGLGLLLFSMSLVNGKK
ncbi:MFS transporter [Patescibacteria group bacterium]